MRTGWRRCLALTAVAIPLATVLVAWLLTVPSEAQPAGDSSIEMVRYTAPLHTAVIDPFRPPMHIGAPGNRGLEYGESVHQIVATAAAGSVTHAGSVGGVNTVTVQHQDGVRTTYTALLEVFVVEGVWLEADFAIGVADVGFHFGARIGDHYLDPQVLLDASGAQERARLVPPG